MSMLYLDSSLATRAVLVWGLPLLPLSIRVRTFHVPIVSFLFFICIRPHAWMICQPQLAGQIHVGQGIFRPSFLGPSLTRVSSAILNRAAQSPRMLPDSPTAPNIGMNDQSPRPPTCRIKTKTASGHLHLLLRPSPIAAGLEMTW